MLFVYGTLRRGESMDLENDMGTTFVSGQKINGFLYDLGWYPGVKTEAGHFDAGKPSVIGDVFLIRNDKVCEKLDAYEGYPSLYTRLQTETDHGQVVWVYVYNHDVTGEQLIPTGDWQNQKEPAPTPAPESAAPAPMPQAA